MLKNTVVFLALILASCGGSKTPTAPTPPPLAQVAGTWSGTFEATLASGFSQNAVTLALTQAGSGVNGTWVAQLPAWSGNVTGTVDTTNFSGALSFNATSSTGTACTGSGSFSGPAGGATMTWTSPAITGNCTGLPTAIRLVIQRR